MVDFPADGRPVNQSVAPRLAGCSGALVDLMLPAHRIHGCGSGAHRLIPHSVFAKPAHRPARGSSVDALLVHGSHPMEA